MSESVEAVPPAARRNRSIEARREARRLRAEREKLVVEYLNRGISIPEIAAACGVTEKHMRAFVRETLARRMPAPPSEFLAMQVSRLSEALLVAYSAMSGANLRAVDRVVKIVRELDRYHGFVAAERRSLPEAPRLQAPAQDPLALEAPRIGRLEMVPQTLEKIESAPDCAMAPEAAEAQDVEAKLGGEIVSRLAAPAQDPLALGASLTGGLEMARQALEKIESAPKPRTPQDIGAIVDAEIAPILAAPAQDPLALEPPLTGGPEMTPQTPENIESMPGNGCGSGTRAGRSILRQSNRGAPGRRHTAECPGDAQWGRSLLKDEGRR